MIFKWTITNVNVLDKAGETKVITSAEWKYKATEGEKYAERTGIQSLSTADLSSFSDFAEVTESQVITWIEAAMGAEQLNSLKLSMNEELDRTMTTITKTTLEG